MLRVPSWHLHCQDKEPVRVTSAQGMPQGDGARSKGMPGVGVPLEYTGARSRAFGSCTEKGPDPSPAAGLCRTAGPWTRISREAVLIWPCLLRRLNSAEASQGELAKMGMELWASPALPGNAGGIFTRPQLRGGGSGQHTGRSSLDKH